MPKAPFAWTKPGLELEIGIGDFEHLAAPFRLRGKVRELCEHDGPATFDEFSELIEEVRFARAQQLLQGTRFRALALPTAARDSAVHFTLLAASGMIGNQRLEHSGEPQGKSFGSDTLGGNAGALA